MNKPKQPTRKGPNKASDDGDNDGGECRGKLIKHEERRERERVEGRNWGAESLDGEGILETGGGKEGIYILIW